MISLNAFIGKDVIAYWSPSVLTEDEKKGDCCTNVHFLGFAQGWIRFKIWDYSDSNQVPIFVQGAEFEDICIRESCFIRFDTV